MPDPYADVRRRLDRGEVLDPSSAYRGAGDALQQACASLAPAERPSPTPAERARTSPTTRT